MLHDFLSSQVDSSSLGCKVSNSEQKNLRNLSKNGFVFRKVKKKKREARSSIRNY